MRLRSSRETQAVCASEHGRLEARRFLRANKIDLGGAGLNHRGTSQVRVLAFLAAHPPWSEESTRGLGKTSDPDVKSGEPCLGDSS